MQFFSPHASLGPGWEKQNAHTDLLRFGEDGMGVGGLAY
jgi:hypothetical protein